MVWLPWDAPGDRRGFLDACRAADVRVVAELGSGDADLVSQARSAGFAGVAFPWVGDEAGLGRVAPKQENFEPFVLLDASRIGLGGWGAVQPVLRAGVWPGAQRPVPGEASATERAWVNSNVHLVAWLRASFSQRPALVSYCPDEAAGVAADRPVPYWSAELAMAEAAVAGGASVLTLPEPLRQALLAGQDPAREAWKSLVRTSRFLQDRAETFRAPVGLRVALLAGPLDECGEILRLMFRFNVTPAVLTAAAPGPLDRYRVVVAVGLGRRPLAQKAALGFARAGGTLLAVPAAENEATWWRVPGLRKVREDDGRNFYSLGRGTLIAYQAPVPDPGELAEDVLDAQGWTRRDLRIWGTDVLIGLARRQPGERLAVDLLNYGARSGEFLVRLEGRFSEAQLHLPGEAPRPLRTALRGTGTEIEMPRLPRVAGLVLA